MRILLQSDHRRRRRRDLRRRRFKSVAVGKPSVSSKTSKLCVVTNWFASIHPLPACQQHSGHDDSGSLQADRFRETSPSSFITQFCATQLNKRHVWHKRVPELTASFIHSRSYTGIARSHIRTHTHTDKFKQGKSKFCPSVGRLVAAYVTSTFRPLMQTAGSWYYHFIPR